MILEYKKNFSNIVKDSRYRALQIEILKKYGSLDLNDTYSITKYGNDVSEAVMVIFDFFSRGILNFDFIDQRFFVDIINSIMEVIKDLSNDANISKIIFLVPRLNGIIDLLKEVMFDYQVKLLLLDKMLKDVLNDYCLKYRDYCFLKENLTDNISMSNSDLDNLLNRKLQNFNISLLTFERNGFAIENELNKVDNSISSYEDMLRLLGQLDSALNELYINIPSNGKSDVNAFNYDSKILKDIEYELNKKKKASLKLSPNFNYIYDIKAINISKIGDSNLYFDIKILYNNNKYLSISNLSETYPLFIKTIIKLIKGRKNVIFIGDETKKIFLDELVNFDYNLEEKKLDDNETISYRINLLKKYMPYLEIILKNIFVNIFGEDNFRIVDIKGFGKKGNIIYGIDNYKGNIGIDFAIYDNELTFTLNLYKNNLQVKGKINNDIANVIVDWELIGLDYEGHVEVNDCKEINCYFCDDNDEVNNYGIYNEVMDEDKEFVLSYLKLIGIEKYDNFLKVNDYTYSISYMDGNICNYIYFMMDQKCGFIMKKSVLILEDSKLEIEVGYEDYYLEKEDDVLKIRGIITNNNDYSYREFNVHNDNLRSKVLRKSKEGI